MVVGQNVKRLRYLKGWGPERLANAAAISRTSLFLIESGVTRLPRASTAKRLADALGVTVDEIFGCVPDQSPFPLQADSPAEVGAMLESMGIRPETNAS